MKAFAENLVVVIMIIVIIPLLLMNLIILMLPINSHKTPKDKDDWREIQ